MPRTIAISDIHGCLAALDKLLELIDPQPQDTLVSIGDYVDRGPQSRGVLERLMALERQAQLVPLLGNHDEMMLAVCEGREDLAADWLVFGGEATLASFAAAAPKEVAQGSPPIWISSAAAACFMRQTGISSSTATTWPNSPWTNSRGRRCCGGR